MGTIQVLPLWVRVDLGVMTMKGCSTFHQMSFVSYLGYFVGESYPSTDMQSVYSTAPAARATIRWFRVIIRTLVAAVWGGLTPLQTCIQRILQPQPTWQPKSVRHELYVNSGKQSFFHQLESVYETTLKNSTHNDGKLTFKNKANKKISIIW